MDGQTRSQVRARLRSVLESASIEDNLKILGSAGLALFLTLIACLFYVQSGLVSSQEGLTQRTLPVRHALGQLTTVLGSAFQREAQLLSAQSDRELDALHDRQHIESELRQTEARLVSMRAFASGSVAERRLRQLHGQVEGFLTTDAELQASVERRHVVQAQFETQLAAVDRDLRLLVEAAQSIAGILRLDFIVTLRQIDQPLRHGGAAPTALMREITVGATRGALDDIAELVDGTLATGLLVGKVGLAPNQDVLNSVIANEIAQNRGQIEHVLDALAVKLRRHRLLERVEPLRARWRELAPRVVDENRADSLSTLRRTVLKEIVHAAENRERSIARARDLTALLDDLRAAATAMATDSIAAAGRAATRARWFSATASCIGMVVCLLAALRIRQSVSAMRANNRTLSELKQNLEHVNSHLETIVDERTAALLQREQALQLVLDSMTDGVISTTPDGALRAERSRTVMSWFGAPAPDATIWSYLFAGDPERSEAFRVGFEQLVAGELPFELCAEQMPHLIERGERSYALEFQAARQDSQLVGVVIAIRDVTEQIEAERAERLAREEQRTIGHLLRDKRGFSRMVRECESLMLQVIGSEDLVLRHRALHTLKGNCAIFGMVSVAECAHELETRLSQQQTLRDVDIELLEQIWHDAMVRIEEFVAHARDTYEVEEADLELVLAALRQRADYNDILNLVEAFRLEPAGAPLKRLGAQARRLAQELGKNLQVQVVDNGLRLAPERFQSLFSAFVHAIRNAIDHGIEPPAVRLAAGKPEAGTLSLRVAKTEDDKLVFELADDGGGIDYEAVRAKARARGMPAETLEDLQAALFSDGFSTRDQATQVSGRGVGMSALRAACLDMHGTIELQTSVGRGTVLRCIVPMPSPFPDASVRRSRNPHSVRSASLRSARPLPSRA